MHQLPAQLLLGPLIIILLQGLAHHDAHLLHGVALPHLSGEGIVQFIGSVAADLMNAAAELRRFARQLRGMVLGGKGNAHRHVVADVGAHQLLLKTGDEHTAAQRQRLLFGGAAGELDTLGKSGVVQHQFIAQSGSPACDGYDTGVGLQQPLHLTVDLLRRHRDVLQRALQVQIGKTHAF